VKTGGDGPVEHEQARGRDRTHLAGLARPGDELVPANDGAASGPVHRVRGPDAEPPADGRVGHGHSQGQTAVEAVERVAGRSRLWHPGRLVVGWDVDVAVGYELAFIVDVPDHELMGR